MNDLSRAALEPVRRLIAEALVELEQDGNLEDIVNLIHSRGSRRMGPGQWLLTARILANCAVGVGEGWPDAHDLHDEVRKALLADLAVLVSQGIGEELTPQRFAELRTDIDCRPVSWRQVAVPLLFVIETSP